MLQYLHGRLVQNFKEFKEQIRQTKCECMVEESLNDRNFYLMKCLKKWMFGKWTMKMGFWGLERGF